MYRSLSYKQKRILDFIIEKVDRDGYPPSVREICEAVELKSPSTVHSHLKKLESMGYLTKEGHKTRALKVDVLSNENASVRVPILGRVAAGEPVLAEESVSGYVHFPAPKAVGKDLFALRVSGESMINVGIFDGDIVVVEKTSYARNGEIVVVLVDNEATVKRFYRENGRFRLQPENSDMEPIIVKEAVVLGRVIATLRFYDIM